jgi:hypothetical protein
LQLFIGDRGLGHDKQNDLALMHCP